MSTKIYKLGDSVWHARCGKRDITNPCPVCFGKLCVRVELGNGELVTTPCDYCGKGYAGPTGVETTWQWIADSALVSITRVEIDQTSEGDKARYQSANYILDPEDIFATKEEADARCMVRSAENDLHESGRQKHLKEYAHRNFSWHVGYHRRKVKDLTRQLAWHEARAITCKEQSKSSP